MLEKMLRPRTEAAKAEDIKAIVVPPVEEKHADAEPKTEIKKLEEKPAHVRPVMRPHAFVIMPFGTKKGSDGQVFNFNAIYNDLIKPTLEMAGFEPFRADEATTSGDILTDMFQELLLADLALVDMSIDNANVFYELGIRHAFRKRSVVHIQAGRAYMPFDIFNVRTIPYHITPEGVPDVAFLEKDKQAIARVTRDTWASDPDAIHSPVFNLLTGLAEPDRKTLRTPLATGFWREYNEWKQRVTIAQRQHRIGDLLLLTEEIKNPLIKEEAIGEAGQALANMGRNELALNQYRKGLEINSRNLIFRQQEAFHLNRLGRVDEAIVKIENLLVDFPNDSESISYLGRIYKETWVESWKRIKEKAPRLHAAFDSYHWLIKSINTYLKAYRVDLNQFYPGVNALTLMTILVHLADRFDDKNDPDPEITTIRNTLAELRGTLLFALENKSTEEKADYWTLVSLAEMRVLTSDNVQSVMRAYRKALTASRRNIFFLQSSLSQLEILHSLDMRQEYVTAGIKVIHEELGRFNKGVETNGKKKASKKEEGRVFVFSGYMIDDSNAQEAKFPADKEADVKDEIMHTLQNYHAGPGDLAFTSGLSSGSEILFAECCIELGIHIESHFCTPEAMYIRDFVSPSGDKWVDRFYKIRNHPFSNELIQTDYLGLPKDGDNIYERNNRWTVYSSLIHGVDKVHLIAFWDGKAGRPKDHDAQLVKHMVDLMRETGGHIDHINSLKFLGEDTTDNAATIAPSKPAKKSASRK